MPNLPQNTTYDTGGTLGGLNVSNLMNNPKIKSILSAVNQGQQVGTASIPAMGNQLPQINTSSLQPWETAQPTQAATGPSFGSAGEMMVKSVPTDKPVLSTPLFEGGSMPLTDFMRKYPDLGLNFDREKPGPNARVIHNPQSGGYYVEDPDQPNTVIHSARTNYTPEENAVILSGLPNKFYQIDHIDQLNAGSLDVLQNKEILTGPQHLKKTKIQAVPFTLWKNGLLSLDEYRRASSWRDKSDIGIPQPYSTGAETGQISLQKALDTWHQWGYDYNPTTKLASMAGATPTAYEMAKATLENLPEATDKMAKTYLPLPPMTYGFIKDTAKGIFDAGTFGLGPKALSWAGDKANDLLAAFGDYKGFHFAPTDDSYKGIKGVWLDYSKMPEVADAAERDMKFGEGLGDFAGNIFGSFAGFEALSGGLSLLKGLKALPETMKLKTALEASKAAATGLEAVKTIGPVTPLVPEVFNLPAIKKMGDTARQVEAMNPGFLARWIGKVGTGTKAIETFKNTEEAAKAVVADAEAIGPKKSIWQLLPSWFTKTGGVAKEFVPEEVQRLAKIQKFNNIGRAIGLMGTGSFISEFPDLVQGNIGGWQVAGQFAKDVAYGTFLGRDPYTLKGYTKVGAKAMMLSSLLGYAEGKFDVKSSLENATAMMFMHYMGSSGSATGQNKEDFLNRFYAGNDKGLMYGANQWLARYFGENEFTLHTSKDPSTFKADKFQLKSSQTAPERIQQMRVDGERALEQMAKTTTLESPDGTKVPMWSQEDLDYEKTRLNMALDIFEAAGKGSAGNNPELDEIAKKYLGEMSDTYKNKLIYSSQQMDPADMIAINGLKDYMFTPSTMPKDGVQMEYKRWAPEDPSGVGMTTGVSPELAPTTARDLSTMVRLANTPGAVANKGLLYLDEGSAVYSNMNKAIRMENGDQTRIDLHPENVVRLITFKTGPNGELIPVHSGYVPSEARNTEGQYALNNVPGEIENLKSMGRLDVLNVDKDAVAPFMREKGFRVIPVEIYPDGLPSNPETRPWIKFRLTSDHIADADRLFPKATEQVQPVATAKDVETALKSVTTPEEMKAAVATIRETGLPMGDAAKTIKNVIRPEDYPQVEHKMAASLLQAYAEDAAKVLGDPSGLRPDRLSIMEEASAKYGVLASKEEWNRLLKSKTTVTVSDWLKFVEQHTENVETGDELTAISRFVNGPEGNNPAIKAIMEQPILGNNVEAMAKKAKIQAAIKDGEAKFKQELAIAKGETPEAPDVLNPETIETPVTNPMPTDFLSAKEPVEVVERPVDVVVGVKHDQVVENPEDLVPTAPKGDVRYTEEYGKDTAKFDSAQRQERAKKFINDTLFNKSMAGEDVNSPSEDGRPSLAERGARIADRMTRENMANAAKSFSADSKTPVEAQDKFIQWYRHEFIKEGFDDPFEGVDMNNPGFKDPDVQLMRMMHNKFSNLGEPERKFTIKVFGKEVGEPTYYVSKSEFMAPSSKSNLKEGADRVSDDLKLQGDQRFDFAYIKKDEVDGKFSIPTRHLYHAVMNEGYLPFATSGNSENDWVSARMNPEAIRRAVEKFNSNPKRYSTEKDDFMFLRPKTDEEMHRPEWMAKDPTEGRYEDFYNFHAEKRTQASKDLESAGLSPFSEESEIAYNKTLRILLVDGLGYDPGRAADKIVKRTPIWNTDYLPNAHTMPEVNGEKGKYRVIVLDPARFKLTMRDALTPEEVQMFSDATKKRLIASGKYTLENFNGAMEQFLNSSIWDGHGKIYGKTMGEILNANGFYGMHSSIQPRLNENVDGIAMRLKARFGTFDGKERQVIEDMIREELKKDPTALANVNYDPASGEFKLGEGDVIITSDELKEGTEHPSVLGDGRSMGGFMSDPQAWSFEYSYPHNPSGTVSHQYTSKFSFSDALHDPMMNKLYKPQLELLKSFWADFNESQASKADLAEFTARWKEKVPEFGFSPESVAWGELENALKSGASWNSLRRELTKSTDSLMRDWYLTGKFIQGDNAYLKPASQIKDPVTKQWRNIKTDEIVLGRRQAEAIFGKGYPGFVDPETGIKYAGYVSGSRFPIADPSAIVPLKVLIGEEVAHKKLGDNLAFVHPMVSRGLLVGDFDGDHISLQKIANRNIEGDSGLPFELQDTLVNRMNQFGIGVLPMMNDYPSKPATFQNMMETSANSTMGGDGVAKNAANLRALHLFTQNDFKFKAEVLLKGAKDAEGKDAAGKVKYKVALPVDGKDQLIYEGITEFPVNKALRTELGQRYAEPKANEAQFIQTGNEQSNFNTDSAKKRNLSDFLIAEGLLSPETGFDSSGYSDTLLRMMTNVKDPIGRKAVADFVNKLGYSFQLSNDAYQMPQRYELRKDMPAFADLVDRIKTAGGNVPIPMEVTKALSDAVIKEDALPYAGDKVNNWRIGFAGRDAVRKEFGGLAGSIEMSPKVQDWVREFSKFKTISVDLKQELQEINANKKLGYSEREKMKDAVSEKMSQNFKDMVSAWEKSKKGMDSNDIFQSAFLAGSSSYFDWNTTSMDRVNGLTDFRFYDSGIGDARPIREILHSSPAIAKTYYKGQEAYEPGSVVFDPTYGYKGDSAHVIPKGLDFENEGKLPLDVIAGARAKLGLPPEFVPTAVIGPTEQNIDRDFMFQNVPEDMTFKYRASPPPKAAQTVGIKRGPGAPQAPRTSGTYKAVQSPTEAPKPAVMAKSGLQEGGNQSRDIPATNKMVTGDLWEQPGYKIITTNLGGIHGAGLAQQAAEKGLITRKKNFDFDHRPENDVITIAVKGRAPETAVYKGQAWSEATTGGNVDLFKSELEKLAAFARANPDKRFNVPLGMGLGHGDGDPTVLGPIRNEILGGIPNVVFIQPSPGTIDKYKNSFRDTAVRGKRNASPTSETNVPKRYATLATTVKKATGKPAESPVESVPSGKVWESVGVGELTTDRDFDRLLKEGHKIEILNEYPKGVKIALPEFQGKIRIDGEEFDMPGDAEVPEKFKRST